MYKNAGEAIKPYEAPHYKEGHSVIYYMDETCGDIMPREISH